MSSTAESYVMTKLKAAGFYPMKERSGKIEDRLRNTYAAFVRVDEVKLSELVLNGVPDSRADVSVTVRALGKVCGFRDSKDLEDKTDAAASKMFFDSDILIKEISCQKISADLVLGRLEREIKITLSYGVHEGTVILKGDEGA